MSSAVSLEELVKALSRYGRAHIMLHDNECWTCSAKLRTNTPGATFDVKSAFNKHRDMRGAVEECLMKAVEAVAKFEFVPKDR